ncbi:MAG: glycosyltransferase family 9 protein [Verrucomicrobiota bacterium]
MKILIFHQGSLGDTVISIPAIRAIRRHYGKDAYIVLLHEKRNLLRVRPDEILQANVLINEFIGYDVLSSCFLKRWLGYAFLGLKLFQRKFDAVHYLLSSSREYHRVRRDQLFFTLCGIAKKFGFNREHDSFVLEKDSFRIFHHTHEAAIHLQRLKAEGIDISLEENLNEPFLQLSSSVSEKALRWLQNEGLLRQYPLVAVGALSNMPSKQWPLERFEHICQRLIQQYNAHIIFLGSSADRDAIQKIVDRYPQSRNAAGMFSPLESAAIIKHCHFTLGLDSGPIHLAGALGVPCVAIYSERNYPGQWDPLGEKHLILRHPVMCQGCQREHCHLPDHPCIRQISTEEVWSKIQQIMLRHAREKT